MSSLINLKIRLRKEDTGRIYFPDKPRWVVERKSFFGWKPLLKQRFKSETEAIEKLREVISWQLTKESILAKSRTI